VSAPVFVVPADRLAVGEVVVDGAEGRHAATVTRLTAGEPVVLVDGLGGRADGVVATVDRDRLVATVAVVEQQPPSQPRFVVVQALPKGDRGEVAVETMTEVGVDVVVPWAAQRCVTRWREGRGDKALAGWRSTARAAAKQSRRSRFPEVTRLASTGEVAELLAGASAGVVLHEEAGGTADRLGDTVLRPSTAGTAALAVLLAKTRWR